VRYGPTPLHVSADEADFGAYLNFLHFGEATLTFPQTLVLRYQHFEPAERKQPQVADDYSRWFLARLRAVDAVLQGNEFLCAGRFTAADVAVGYALMLAGHLNLDAQFPPAVAAYWQRLQLRPAFQRAMAIQHQAALDQGVPTTPAPDIRPN
jgi:glutathione S-transferase